MMVFKMYLLSNMASFWVSMVVFGGVFIFMIREPVLVLHDFYCEPVFFCQGPRFSNLSTKSSRYLKWWDSDPYFWLFGG